MLRFPLPGPAERSSQARFVPHLEALEVRTVPSYVFSSFDNPNAGTLPGQGTGAFGINEQGDIVGAYTDPTFAPLGFLLGRGQYTTINDPNEAPFFPQSALGINTLGNVVGMYTDSNIMAHGFLYRNGQYTTLDDPNAGGGGTVAAGINELGQVAGYYFDPVGTIHGFLLNAGHYTTLDDPNAGTTTSEGTYALGVNSLGQVVGQYVDSSFHTHGFLLSFGHYTTLDDPNATNLTVAEGINEFGQVVGYYQDGTTVHGFLYSFSHFTTLDDPNAGIFGGTQAGGINSSGDIVGFYVDVNGVEHGFLAKPELGGFAASPTGHGGGRLDEINTGQSSSASLVQGTLNRDQTHSPLGGIGQDMRGRIELFFAARLTASQQTSRSGDNPFGGNEELIF
ncbi:MAG TPA: hypothetical protein VKU02_23175 [Gemmataceae bacterium]|nr:hypothetical protein [Gemmataceae bacterium]